MGILSQLVGQLSGFGLNYLNDYLVQKRLEDSMRQSTNYLTGTAIPEAQKATGFQESMLEGQAPPGAASLLGFTSPPVVREPYGPQAQKLAESVQYNPQIPEGMPVTPQLQAQVMDISRGVAGQPRAMIGEMAKAQEQKQKDFRQRVKDNLDMLKAYAPEYGVSPETLLTNARKEALTNNPADLVANLPGDFPQKVMNFKMQQAQATGLGAATGRGAYEAGPGMDIFRQKAEITAATGAAYREPKEPKEPKEVSPKMAEDMTNELQRTNPELFGKIPKAVPGKGLIYLPGPKVGPIVSKALQIYRSQKARDMYDALAQAKREQMVQPQTQVPSLRENLKKKGFLR